MIAADLDPGDLAELRALLAGRDGRPAASVTTAEIDACLRAAEVSSSALDEAFETQVERAPDAVALAGEGPSVRYGELDEQANRIAWRLEQTATERAGADSQSLVAVCAATPSHVVAAVLGVLKAGRSFLLLDPADPPRFGGAALRAAARSSAATARSSAATGGALDIVADAGAAAWLATAVRLGGIVPSTTWIEALTPGHGSKLERAASLGRLACASWSGGRLLASTHSALASRVAWLEDVFSLGPSDVVLARAPARAEALVRDVLWPLLFGARVVVAPALQRGQLGALIAEHSVSVAHLTPADLVELAASGPPFPSLRAVLSTGEPLSQDLVDRFLAHHPCALHHARAVPEAGGEIASWTSLAGDARTTAPLGRPAATSVHVLDRHLTPAPLGVTGDLFASGDTLPTGYLDDPGQTASRFLPDPFAERPGARMVWTGERGRLLEDGVLEAVPASDGRVYRGDRAFDLGEIEVALASAPGVLDGAALLRESAASEPEVVACVVTEGPLQTDVLHEHLAARLPRALLPDAYCRVARLPLSPGGRVDRAVLARLEVPTRDLLERWERRLSSAPGVAEAAVFLRSVAEEVPALHVSDLVAGEVLGSRAGSREGAPLDTVAVSTAGSREGPAQGGEAEIPLDKAPVRAIADGGPFVLPSGAPATLREAIERAAQSFRGTVFLDAAGVETSLSYADLLDQARRVVSGLRIAGLAPGDEVLLQLEDARQLIPAYWGAILGGFIPVPAGVPPGYRGPSAARKRLEGAFRMLLGPRIVTSEKRAPELRALSESLGDLRIETIEHLLTAEPAAVLHERRPDDVAVVLLTSGSTGGPKPVALRDRNILARTLSMAAFLGLSSEDVTLNWMPLDHVVGLVMFHTRDLILGSRQLHAETAAVLEDPLLWLSLLDRHRVTVTWAPNFAFGLVNRHDERIARGSWDLSSVRIIQNGGEAVVAGTARRFLAQLAPHGLPATSMYPGWGMSETGAAVCFSLDFGQGGADDAFVDLGRPIPGVAMRIVDTGGHIVTEGVTGRLLVRGAPIITSYYKAPALDRQAFTEEGWFDTGDLAFLRGGRLTLTGREKDVIIVRGINHGNHEIESVVEEASGVEPSFAAACAVRPPGSETDRVAIFFSPKTSIEGSLTALCREIRESVGKRLGLSPDYVIPLAKADFPRTSIGKIQRSALVRAFESGELDGALRAIDLECRNERTLPAWFYRPVWIRKDLPSMAPVCPRKALLVGSGALPDELARRIREAGGDARIAATEEGFALHGAVDDVFFIASRDAAATGAAALASAERLLLAYQSIATLPVDSRPLRLVVVSHGAASVDPVEPLSLADLPLAGMTRTLALEAPWLEVRHVDLPLDATAAAATSVLAELGAFRGDAEVAYRKGCRFVPALARADMASRPLRDPVVTGGLYLVTGGLGGIGSAVAERLVRRYRTKLLLVGRTALPQPPDGSPGGRRRARLSALEALGDVTYETADVADAIGLREAVSAAEARWGRALDGIFHFAGEGDIQSHLATIESRWLAAETASALASAFRAKVSGTLALAELLEGRPDALFVASSSVNGLLGAATFGAYAAASSFLDGFCADRRRRGYPRTYALDWTAWDEVGMNEGAPTAAAEASRRMGYHLLSKEQGVLSLLACLSREGGVLAVGLDGASDPVRRRTREAAPRREALSACIVRCPGEEARWDTIEIDDRFGTKTRCEVVAVEALPRSPSGAIDEDALPLLFAGARKDGSDRTPPRTDEERIIAGVWREVLGRADIGVFDDFFELGGHSLRAAQVIARLRDRLGVDLPLRRLFEAPTIAGLAAAIAGQQADGVAEESIAALPPGAPRPLSFAQERLWFLAQIEPDSPAYNIAGAVRIEGDLDMGALGQAFSEVLRRHAVLRTTFAAGQDAPRQIVHDDATLSLSLTDRSGSSREAVLREVAAEARRPFDLERGPLLRVRLVRVGDGEHVLSITMHHAVSDGWSMGILVREIAALYEAFSRGLPSPLPPLPFQYADHAASQRQRLDGDLVAAEIAAWKAHLAGAETVLDLPFDRPRPAVQAFRGKRQSFELSASLSAAVRALALREGTTLFMTLFAAFSVLLSRYSGKRDLLVGTPVAGRREASAENLIGLFLNTVVLRADLSGDPSFRELARHVKEDALFAFAHQELPFEKLVAELGSERDLRRTPIFQVMFVLQNAPQPPLELSGLRLSPLDVDLGTSQLDWLLSIEDSEGALRGSVQYDTDLFDDATITRMTGHLGALLDAAARCPEQSVLDLPMMTPEERRRAVVAWNATERPYPTGLLHRFFEAQADRTPGAVAVSFEGQTLTYRELDGRANRLAHRLRGLGIAPGVLCAVVMDRSLEMVVALYGVLKAGGAYVPIEPSQPVARIAYHVRDAGAPVLLTHSHLVDRLPASGAALVCLDAGAPCFEGEPDTRLETGAGPDDLAYVIYTSGSTGRPKGAMNTHAGIVNRLLWMQETFPLGEGDRVLQKTPFGFDVSVWELFWPLLAGARLVVARPDGHMDPDYLSRTVAEQGITTLHFVPSMLRAFLEDDGAAARCGSLRRVFASGEALPLALTERFFRAIDAELHNLYGPTEAAIDVTHFACERRPRRAVVPIGKPIANTRAYVLDERREPLPVGVPGELYLGGVQLARGYWKRPELTADRFVESPFGRLYRTGDRARFLPDGNIEFLGRLDHQIKLHGVRIELGEIEAALDAHPGLSASVVLLREDTPGAGRLVAYAVAREAVPPSVGDLRAFLRKTLPDSMVPSAFVFLEQLPLTASGKIDRGALPAPGAPLPRAGAAHVPPRTPGEEVLASLFAAVLRLPRVSIHDGFFELGGDSILAIQVVSRAREQGIVLSPRDVFQKPTVAELAAVAGTSTRVRAEQGPVLGPVLLTPIQRRFFEDEGPCPRHFNQALLLEVRERLEMAPLEEALRALLEHHDALRLRFFRDEQGIREESAAPDGSAPLSRVDLAGLPYAEQRRAIESAAEVAQASLDLERGPLVRAVLFDLGQAASNRLLLVIHHLAVDGVSWRILLDDLWNAHEQARRGEPVRLPRKTTSFQEWAARVEGLSQGGAARGELEDWLSAARASGSRLPPSRSGEGGTEASARSIEKALTPAETDRLVREAPGVYGAEVRDLLLTALALAFKAVSGSPRLAVSLEGHGREHIADDVDVTRTVGWFTVIFPVVLDVDGEGPGEALKSVKERLRAVPRGGLGHGLLRHGSDEEAAAELGRLPEPEVLFNYLGQLDQALPASSPFRMAPESPGRLRSPLGRRRHAFEVSCSVIGGCLSTTWIYDGERHDEGTVGALVEGFLGALRGLVDHCLSPGAGGYTPSDFRRVKLSAGVIDAIAAKVGQGRA